MLFLLVWCFCGEFLVCFVAGVIFTGVIFTGVVLTWCESQVRARKGAQRLVTEFGGMFAVLV